MIAAQYDIRKPGGKRYTIVVSETFDSRSYDLWWERKDGDREIIAQLFVARKGETHDELTFNLLSQAMDYHNER